MSGQRRTTEGWLRPRDGHGQGRRHRVRRHYRLGPAFEPRLGQLDLEMAAATAPNLAPGAAPSLDWPEPETTRSAVVSGALSVAAHALILGLLALSAWLAPEVVENLIPVQIIREAPKPPPPAPRRVVVPRRAVARARVPTSVRRPTPVARPVAQTVAARSIQQANIRPTAAPTQITPRQVTSQRVVAQRTLASPNASAIQVAQLPTATATVGASDLTAPAVDLTGPREIAPAAAVDVTAPQVFGDYAGSENVQYAEAAGATASGVGVPLGDTGFEIDAALSDGAQSFGVAGGTGVASTGTSCTQRPSVRQYYVEVRDRTLAAWRDLPDAIPTDATVVLDFVLDESGTASAVSVSQAPSVALGASCKQALAAASPFPSMGEDVRCLAGRKLKATFKIPVKGSP